MTMRLIIGFSNHWLMVGFEFMSDNARNCDESILVGKENETIIECKKKGILNLAYKQGLSFKNFKESDMFKEIPEEIGVSKSTVYFKVKLV